jgi:hypothetical protein
MQILILAIVAGTLLLYPLSGVLRGLSAAYGAYRLRASLLQELQRNPDMPPSTTEVYARLQAREVIPRENHALSGAILMALGVACTSWGWSWHVGPYAVGAFYGGIACAFLGAALLVVGLFIQAVMKQAYEPLG